VRVAWGLGVEIFLVGHEEAHREGTGFLVGIGGKKMFGIEGGLRVQGGGR
jgi:hypothetical protein